MERHTVGIDCESAYMPIDDDTERERRAMMNGSWAKERARANVRAQSTSSSRLVYLDPTHSRKQVATRVQLAAGEALATLRRKREETRD